MNDYVNQQVRQFVDAEMTKREMDILSGCTRCECRIVADGKPANGATMVFPHWGVGMTPKPFCGDCLANHPEECHDLLIQLQR